MRTLVDVLKSFWRPEVVVLKVKTEVCGQNHPQMKARVIPELLRYLSGSFRTPLFGDRYDNYLASNLGHPRIFNLNCLLGRSEDVLRMLRLFCGPEDVVLLFKRPQTLF